MNLINTFDPFYKKLQESFSERTFEFASEKFLSELSDLPDFDKSLISYAQIMFSSWKEFLNNLYQNNNIEYLSGNLINHLNFIKRLSENQLEYHLIKLKEIYQTLFEYIVNTRVVFRENAEFEEDIKTIELELYQFDKNLKLVQLFFYLLKKHTVEINEITGAHIRHVINALEKGNSEEFHKQVQRLKSIQETIQTALQMDREEELSPVAQRLQKEFQTINQFFMILRQLMESKQYHHINRHHLEVKTSFDYPFLDVLKNISKWIVEGEEKYLNNAKKIFDNILAKNPYRKEDVAFLEAVEMILDIIEEYRKIDSGKFETPFPILMNIISNRSILPTLKNYISTLLDDIITYPELLSDRFNEPITFFLRICANDSISLLYRKKLLKYIAVIIKFFAKDYIIKPNLLKKYVTALNLLNNKFQKQSLVKLGQFKKVTYQFPDDYMLMELEKGIATQMLYALEDFVDWQERNKYINKLKNSPLKEDSRFIILEKLINVAVEISDYKDLSKDIPASGQIKTSIIMTMLQVIIIEHYSILPPTFCYFYSAIIIHTINLAYDNNMITAKERLEVLSKLKEKHQSLDKKYSLPLAGFKETDLFSEAYEREFSSIMSLWHIFLPIFHINLTTSNHIPMMKKKNQVSIE